MSLCLPVAAISAAAVIWELKLVTIFGRRYTSNTYQLTPTGYRKAQTGAASAVAVSLLTGSRTTSFVALDRFVAFSRHYCSSWISFVVYSLLDQYKNDNEDGEDVLMLYLR